MNQHIYDRLNLIGRNKSNTVTIATLARCFQDIGHERHRPRKEEKIVQYKYCITKCMVINRQNFHTTAYHSTYLRGTKWVAFLPFSCAGTNWDKALATVAMPWRPAKAAFSFCDRPLRYRTTSPRMRSRGASWLLGQGDSPQASTSLLSSLTSFCSCARWSEGSLDRSAFGGGAASRALTLCIIRICTWCVCVCVCVCAQLSKHYIVCTHTHNCPNII